MKKRVSAFVLLLLLQSISLNAQNLIQNGDFEQGKTGWFFTDNAHAKITKESFHGQKAISCQDGGINQDISLSQTVDTNKHYILAGYYKTAQNVDGIWLGIVYMDKEWNTLLEKELSLNPQKTDYTPFLLVSKPPLQSKYISFWTWSESKNGGKTYFDTFTFVKESTTKKNHPPIIENIPTQQNQTNELLSFQIKANDLDNDPLLYQIEGLPGENISIDTQTGIITGKVLQSGEYNITITVTDTKNSIAQKSFLWKFTQPTINPCNRIQNGDFETDTENWDTYAQYELSVNAYHGNKALHLLSGGLDQTITLTGNKSDTFQFHGFYHTQGNIEGAWLGIIFYDNNFKVLSSQEITLSATNTYQPFTLNTTNPKNAKYLQTWIWLEEGKGGSLMLDDLKVSQSSCFKYVIPSSLPPGNLAISDVPQFVVIGFDDNTKAEGIEWAINLFKNKKNLDGSDARVSFYFNTKGFSEWIEDDPQQLLNAVKKLKNSGHEVGNHTYSHHADIDSSDWDQYIHKIINLADTSWKKKLEKATNDLVTLAGFSEEEIVGFRAPYLLYTQALFNQLKSKHFLYDCSIEEGHATQFDGTNFRWPYQLNAGSPGHNESWYNNPNNPNHVTITGTNDLWELPNYVLMIPSDKECTAYGIKSGLWSRIKTKLPYVEDYKITGFDYNLWSEAELNKSEVLGILKYNLDLRLKGNRAPLMFGAHTQYYTETWANAHSKNATYRQMRAAISEFVDYALSKPQVRIIPAKKIIQWCISPIPLSQRNTK